MIQFLRRRHNRGCQSSVSSIWRRRRIRPRFLLLPHPQSCRLKDSSGSRSRSSRDANGAQECLLWIVSCRNYAGKWRNSLVSASLDYRQMSSMQKCPSLSSHGAQARPSLWRLPALQKFELQTISEKISFPGLKLGEGSKKKICWRANFSLNGVKIPPHSESEKCLPKLQFIVQRFSALAFYFAQ